FSMNQRKPPPSLEDLDARLRKARGDTPAAGQAEGMDRKAPMSGLGLALRIGIELVAPLAVGVGIGWLLDDWLGTGPWLMVVFFFLGAGAGFLNVYRTVSNLGLAAGHHPPGAKDGDKRGEENGNQ
ncbi:MAG: AtpZ/AtpI family protein, partial [Alphaproteobacteria bacterium]